MREKLTRQHQEWVERRPERILWRCARDRAAEKGLSFTIRPEDIRIPDRCPLLAVPLVHNRGRKGPGANSPTIDRIDPSKGYDPGNIWVVSYRANAIKNDATPDELELIAGRVRARLAEE